MEIKRMNIVPDDELEHKTAMFEERNNILEIELYGYEYVYMAYINRTCIATTCKECGGPNLSPNFVCDKCLFAGKKADQPQ